MVTQPDKPMHVTKFKRWDSKKDTRGLGEVMDIYNNFLKQVILKSKDPGMPRGL